MSTMKPLPDLAQTQEALQEIEKKYDERTRIAQTRQALEKNESIAQNKDVVKGYYKLLTGDNELAQMGAAKAWSKWEGQTSTLQPSNSVLSSFTEPHTAMSLSRIECHYFMNNSFLEENQILNNIDKISHIPGTIVQGRYDMVCPMESAYELYEAWPNAELDIIPDAGHSAAERGIVDALVRTTISYCEKFKKGA